MYGKPSWSTVKTIATGKLFLKKQKRHQINIPCFVLYVVIFAIVILYTNLVVSGSADEKIDMKIKENKYMQMVLLFDIVILTVFIYIYMIGLARVNKLALDTVTILENNSTLYKHLIIYKDYYFPGLDKSDDPYRQEVSCGHDKIFKKETSVHIYYLFSHIVEE
jgi:hypothetical protein